MYLALQFLLAPFLFPKTEISLDIPFNALGKEHFVIDLI
jgi:hypothetical protein